jgi:hypothetical protein
MEAAGLRCLMWLQQMRGPGCWCQHLHVKAIQIRVGRCGLWVRLVLFVWPQQHRSLTCCAPLPRASCGDASYPGAPLVHQLQPLQEGHQLVSLSCT